MGRPTQMMRSVISQENIRAGCESPQDIFHQLTHLILLSSGRLFCSQQRFKGMNDNLAKKNLGTFWPNAWL